MSSERRTLRFGILCDGTMFPAWQAHCLELLASSPDVEPALLVVNGEPETGGGFRDKVKKVVSGRVGLWEVYHKLHVRKRSLAARPVDLAEELAGLPRISCRVVRKGRFSEYFPDEDVAKIREADLDFLLRFSFGILRGEILEAARYGVWSFHHDDEQRYRGGPPCFWEVFHGDPATGAILQRLTRRLDGGIVLHKGFFRTSRTSYVTSVDTAFFGSAVWPLRVCRDVLNGEAGYLEAPPTTTKAPIYRKPGNVKLTRYFFKVAARFLVDKLRGLVREDQWNVGIAEEPIQAFLGGEPPAVKWLPEPARRSRFLADPFGFVENGRLKVVAEAFDYRDGKGWIATLGETEAGAFTQPEAVLDLDVHASYPFLVSWEGETYCVPETHQAGEVTLFKATRPPWERVTTLIRDFPALDPTLFRHGGRWWLFASKIETARGFDARDADMKLYAWWAPELLGPWRPHAANPLKTDVRSSRPAGTPFVHEGELYRPAQDVSVTYGGRVVLNRVTELSPTRFEEEQAGVVEPYAESPYREGLHHLAAAGEMTLVDGKRSLFIPEVFGAKLARNLGRLVAPRR